MGNKNLNGSRDHNNTHPFQGRFVVGVLGLVTIQQCIKFEIFTSTHYEDMKGDEKCRNWGSFGVRGHSRSSAAYPINRTLMTSYSTLIKTASILYRFRVIITYFQKFEDVT